MREEQGRVIVKIKNIRKKELDGKKPKPKRTEANLVVGKNSAKSGISQCFLIYFLSSNKTVEKSNRALC